MPNPVLPNGRVLRRPETLYETLQKNTGRIAGGAIGAAAGGLSGGGLNRAIEFGKIGSNIGNNAQQILKEEHDKGRAAPASVDPNIVPGIQNPTALKQETAAAANSRVDSNEDWSKQGGAVLVAADKH